MHHHDNKELESEKTESIYNHDNSNDIRGYHITNHDKIISIKQSVMKCYIKRQ